MPYDEPRSDDPMELVGVSLPADEEAVREMAYTFAEEFSRLGYGKKRLMKLFREPYYAAAHQAWLTLGDEAILAIVREIVAAFGSVRFVTRDAGPRDAGPSGRRLPVLTAGTTAPSGREEA